MDNVRRCIQTHLSRARSRGLPATLTVEEWERRLTETQGACYFCGSVERLEVEHIVPIAQGGGTTYENCVPACRDCNKERRNNLLYGLYTVDSDVEAVLREMADRLGIVRLTATNGRKHYIGNTAAMLERLAQKYRRSPADTLRILGSLLVQD